MFTYKQMEKIFGVRKQYDFINPKIINSNEFLFPKNSAVLWYHKEYIGNPLFKNIVGPTKVLILDSYFRKLPGKYSKRNIKQSMLNTMAKKMDRDKDFDFVPSVKKLYQTQSNKVIMLDLYRLDTIYKYQKYKASEYDKERNLIETLVDASMEPDRITDRKIFITVPVPRSMPKLNEIKNALKKDGYRSLDIVKNKDMILILEILKMFDEKTKGKSVFSRIKNIESSDIVFVFGYLGKVTMCSIENLFSLSEDNDILTPIKGVSPDKAMKIFITYLMKISLETPRTLEELEKNSKTDVAISNDSKEDDVEDLIEVHNKKVEEELEKDETISIHAETMDEVISKEESFEETAKEYINDKLDDGMVKDSYVKKALPLIEKNNKRLEELKLTKEDIELQMKKLPKQNTVLDEGMLENTVDAFDKQYIKKVYKKQREAILLSFGKSGYLANEIKTEKDTNISDDIEILSTPMLTPNGTTITLNQRIPALDDEGYMKLNTNKYRLRKMKTDVPIKKVKPNEVALTSYYNKMFVKRGEMNKNKQSASILRELKKLKDNNQISMLVLGKATVVKVHLPFLYTTMMSVVKSFIKDKIFFSFNYSKIDELFPKHDKKHGIVVGKDKQNNYYYLRNDGVLLDAKGNDVDDFITFLGIDRRKIKAEYATINMLGERIPLALVLMYYKGITNMFNTLGVKYKEHEANKRVITEHDEYIIRFKDTKYVVKRDWTEVVVGALTVMPELKEGDSKSLNIRSVVRDLMMLIGYKRRTFIELDNLKAMWIDPITEDILKLRKEPTTFVGILYKTAELLKDDYYKPQNDSDGIMVKGYERLNGMLYHIMAKAIRDQTQRQGLVTSKVTVNPYELLGMLSEDGTFVLDTDMNPLNIMKQKEEVTLTGKFGRQKDSIAMNDRVYDPSNFGIISEASKDSADIGITTYLSASPKINNIYGVLKDIDMSEITAANVFSSGVLLMPGSTTDDGKRMLYISIQNAHIIPTKNQRSLPVRTGFESIVPYRMNKEYVTYATEKGKVIKVTDKEVKILYGTKEVSYKLKEWTTKEVGGLAYKHKSVTNLKVGDTVNEYDIIFYDDLFFGRDMFNRKRIVYKVGETALTALEESDETYEDSCAVSKKFSENFTTKVTKVNGKSFSKDIKIKELAELGSKVSHNDIVFSYILTTEDDIGDTVFKKSREKIDDLKTNNVYAEAKGTLFRYEIYYRCELSELSDELQTLVKKTDKVMKELYGYTGKVTNTFSIKGKPLAEDELYIKYYIEKEKTLTIGDKIIVGNQLKNTVGDIYEQLLTEDGRSVDVKISRRSVGARIVNSPEDIATTNLILMEMNKRFAEGNF